MSCKLLPFGWCTCNVNCKMICDLNYCSLGDVWIMICDINCCSLGDVLVNITSNGSSLNMKQMMASEGFSEDSRCNSVVTAPVVQGTLKRMTSEGLWRPVLQRHCFTASAPFCSRPATIHTKWPALINKLLIFFLLSWTVSQALFHPSLYTLCSHNSPNAVVLADLQLLLWLLRQDRTGIFSLNITS